MNQWFKVRRDTAPIFDALCTALRPKREGGESNAPSAMCLLEDSNFRPPTPNESVPCHFRPRRQSETCGEDRLPTLAAPTQEWTHAQV